MSEVHVYFGTWKAVFCEASALNEQYVYEMRYDITFVTTEVMREASSQSMGSFNDQNATSVSDGEQTGEMLKVPIMGRVTAPEVLKVRCRLEHWRQTQ